MPIAPCPARAIAAAVAERFGGEVRIGVAISSGAVVAGSVGGGRRVDFSVIVDAVNVAARVQAITPETADVVLLAGATRRLLGIRDSGADAKGEAELRGLAALVALYSLATQLDERSTLWRKSLITDA